MNAMRVAAILAAALLVPIGAYAAPKHDKEASFQDLAHPDFLSNGHHDADFDNWDGDQGNGKRSTKVGWGLA
jgi:hypothetical protein